MSAAAVLLREIEGRGVELSVAGDTLRWRAPPGAMTAKMKARLKAHKGEVIEFLARARRDSERDTEQNAADAPTSGRTPDTKSKVWDPATGAAVEWFLASAPPARPLELQRGVTIAEPARTTKRPQAVARVIGTAASALEVGRLGVGTSISTTPPQKNPVGKRARAAGEIRGGGVPSPRCSTKDYDGEIGTCHSGGGGIKARSGLLTRQ